MCLIEEAANGGQPDIRLKIGDRRRLTSLEVDEAPFGQGNN